MLEQQILFIRDFKDYAKRTFKDVDLLTKGFAIDCVTVVFRKTTMEINDFDEKNGKLKVGYFILPGSYEELLKKLRHHCGADKINKQL